MEEKSTIRAFQRILSQHRFTDASGFPEEFAIKRFLKKMEIPDASNSKKRKERCFAQYVEFDESLRLPSLLPGNWYKARLLIHDWCKSFRLGTIAFTNGSEATPTHGFNSIESKLLRSEWSCTADCWDLWASLAYDTLAIKRAARARFKALMGHDCNAIRAFHRDSYLRFKNKYSKRETAKLCFFRMLSYVTTLCEASRFSTVRKNNEKDRPIDLQPLCNMLVQRQIGNGLRDLLMSLGVDLDNLAAVHRRRLVEKGIATIDLSNASDSVQLRFVKFLFPSNVFSLINSSRTFFTEGLDGQYYTTNKVSAMGNGFTFELMTVIIRALGLQYDSSFSVFGDDIIIPNQHAAGLIKDLNAVGFVVNEAKSFINSEFRESCGGNYHDTFGYIESYDFEYPETIHDCIVANNKAFSLAKRYPQFRKLSQLLLRTVPKTLQGPAFAIDPDGDGTGKQGYNQDIQLSTTFWSTTMGGTKLDDPLVARSLHNIHQNPDDFKIVYGYRWKAGVASPRRDRLHMRSMVGKYMMYLHAGRICDDVVTDCGSWQRVAYVSDGSSLYRLKALVAPSLHVAVVGP